jgi:uncharacterized protein involved in outer membrane biogenesis
MFKKLAVFIGVLFALLIIAIVTIPMIVDVDKYRPQIVSVANEHLNGKLEIGKLTLSLWGKILVRVDGVKLFDASQKPVVSVQDAYIHIPFSSFLVGSPELNFKMETPEILVTKNRAGKMNVLSLVKTAPVAQVPAAAPSAPAVKGKAAAPAPQVQQAAAPAPQAKAPSASHATMQLPAIATRARMGLELRNAHLTYIDEATALKSETKDLNVIVRDLSLSHPMELEITAQLDTVMAKVFSVKGPMKITGELKPHFSGSDFEQVQGQLAINLDDLVIAVPGVFLKNKGIPAHAEVSLTASPKEAQLEKFHIVFHNADIQASATIVNGTPQTIKGEINSNEIALKEWNELIPMAKSFELGGTLKLKASANGPADKLGYSADVDLVNLTAKAPMLKAKPEINAGLHIVTDQVKDLNLTFKAPGNDLRVTGKVVSFTAPQATLNIESTGMDLDKLIEFPAAPAGGKSAMSFAIPSAEAAQAVAAAADYDKMLDPMRTNTALRSMVANINAQIKFIKAKGTSIENLSTKFTFKNLVANLEKLSMRIYGGSISMKASSDMKPAHPTYSLDAQVSQLDLKEAVASSMQSFKNTVYGKLSMNAKGTGSSFNPDEAKARLNLKGNLKITDAMFTSIDIGKMVGDAVNSGLSKVGDKIPGLKGKSLGKLPNREAKYDSMTSDFTIANGQFNMPNFYAKAAKGSSVDLKGDTRFGLIDQKINAQWMVIDSQDLTKAKEFSVNLGGQNIPHILCKGNDPLTFPVTVKGTASAPDYSYSEVPEYFAKIAMGNSTGAVKSQVMKAAPQLLKKLFK